MEFLFFRAVCNVLFSQLLRLGQAQRPQTLGLITINYLVATFVSLFLAGARGQTSYLPATWALGAVGGIAYIISILLMMPAMRRSGVSVTVAVLQLAVLWPVAYAMVAFGEMPSLAQWIGIAATIAALILLSMGRSAAAESRRVTFSPMLLLLFFVTGISGISMKAFHEYAPARDLPGFMAVLFATATAGGALAMLLQRVRLQRSDLVIGTAIGLPNAAQLEFLLRAMETIPAIIVFPVSSALSLLLNAIASIILWRERLDRPTALGLALALVATVLLNLR